ERAPLARRRRVHRRVVVVGSEQGLLLHRRVELLLGKCRRWWRRCRTWRRARRHHENTIVARGIGDCGGAGRRQISAHRSQDDLERLLLRYVLKVQGDRSAVDALRIHDSGLTDLRPCGENLANRRAGGIQRDATIPHRDLDVGPGRGCRRERQRGGECQDVVDSHDLPSIRAAAEAWGRKSYLRRKYSITWTRMSSSVCLGWYPIMAVTLV